MHPISADLDALLAARETIARRPTADLLAGLDAAVAAWLAPDSLWRRRAEVALADETGFAPAMLRDGLPRLLAPLRAPALALLLREELGEREAIGPRLIAHVLPGNVPALAAPAICAALAVKAAVLVKPGHEERSFAPLFAQSLTEVDAELGACVRVRYWPGGAHAVEDEVFARADAVEVAGGDLAVAAIRPRVRGRFLGRGARVSFAALAREVIADAGELARAARGIAEDASIWEQRGCLSPQVVFAEVANEAELERVADALAVELDEYARRWPPRTLALEEQAAVLRFRQAAEWGFGAGGAERLVCGHELTWTLAIEGHAALEPTCLHRCLRLQPIADLAGLPEVLAPMRPWLEACGLAAGEERSRTLTSALRAGGVHRVCGCGEMQSPDLSWKPGGLPRIAWAVA